MLKAERLYLFMFFAQFFSNLLKNYNTKKCFVFVKRDCYCIINEMRKKLYVMKIDIKDALNESKCTNIYTKISVISLFANTKNLLSLSCL